MAESAAAVPGVRTSWIGRWAGLGAILYVALFIIGAVLQSSGTPSGDAAPAKVIAYYSDDGHRSRIGAGWLLIVIGVFFLLWFLAALRQVVIRWSGEGLLAAVTGLGGAVYAASTLGAFSIDAAIKTMSDDTYQDRVYPELIHAGNDIAYVLHSGGGAAIGAMIVAVSLAALAARALPPWLGWLSVVAGIAAVVSIFFIPWIVIAIWRVLAGGLMTFARRRAPVG